MDTDDLFVIYYGQNALFHNNGNGTFTDVTVKDGLRQAATRWNSGCAFLDCDRDGHLDLSIGARVRVLAKTQKVSQNSLLQVDEVRSAGSYYSQSDLRQHFGFEQAEAGEQLEFRWPSGQIDTFKNLEVNRL